MKQVRILNFMADNVSSLPILKKSFIMPSLKKWFRIGKLLNTSTNIRILTKNASRSVLPNIWMQF